eukprot:RCo043224
MSAATGGNGGGGENVKIAVRVRCFNQRELDAHAERVVRMENHVKGSKTWVKDPNTGSERDFNYDHSFQSFSPDQHDIGEYASQDTVFQALGMPVLNAALAGMNICLFAYGQTGSGKSFSMLGKLNSPDQEGIIPRVCKELFHRIGSEGGDAKYTVDMQIIEIYCEQVNDLLANRKDWPAKGHKPVMTKDGYVVETTKRPCFKFEDIDGAMRFADKNRSIGAHALNPESSRAHTIYQINYQRSEKSADKKNVTTVSSRINLIDLAGSERTESAGTSGQMLKEGNAINLSLTALGACIKALSEEKKPNFRDSKLTLLLQSSMTNGLVIMIAAISPASICYAETMSTLRFADRLKTVRIKAQANVTVDPVEEIRKQMEDMRQRMQAEIDALRDQASGKAVSALEDELRHAKDQSKEEQEALKQQLEWERSSAQRLQQELKQRIAEVEARAAGVAESEEDRRRRAVEQDQLWRSALGGASWTSEGEQSEPHLLNLHEDSRLAETLVYSIPRGKVLKVGRADSKSPPDIEFNGLGITKGHCVLEHTPSGEVYITSGTNSRTLVNGEQIRSRTRLFHNFRVWLGNNYAFRFCFPGREAEPGAHAGHPPPDYAMAQKEVTRKESEGFSDPRLTPVLSQRLTEALNKVNQANVIAKDLERPVRFAPKLTDSPEGLTIGIAMTCAGVVLLWPWEKFVARLPYMVECWQDWQRALEQHA